MAHASSPPQWLTGCGVLRQWAQGVDLLLQVFKRIDLSFEFGKGSWLYTQDGERYLDFASGIAVNSLGH
ncbi:MAG: hypothetical protein AB7E29_08410, partial [Xanthobacter sp.]